MADPSRPLLILPEPGQPDERRRRTGRGAPPHVPDHARQIARLAPQLTRLQAAFDDRRAKLRSAPAGLVPEEVIVLETVGPVEDFFKAVKRIGGMEWLGEYELEDIPPDDDFFALDSRGTRSPEKPLQGRLFMVFSGQNALREMLALWTMWRNGDELPWGMRLWVRLFNHLREVRVWGVNDRLLETGVLEDWEERSARGEETAPVEIELWYLQDPVRRSAAATRVKEMVGAAQGSALRESVIPDIEYHAILAHLPIAAVSELVDRTALTPSWCSSRAFSSFGRRPR